jgi:hypothetical protein
MSSSPDAPLFRHYQCRDCGSEVGFRSRRRNLFERYILPLFLLGPVRCGECFRRDYRLIFTKVCSRFSTASKPMPVSSAVSPKRHVA